MESFWNPLWKVSYDREDCDVQAVMEGLEVDRDGEDPNHISAETQALIDEAGKEGPNMLDVGRGGGSMVTNRMATSSRNMYFDSDGKGEEGIEIGPPM